MSGRVHMKKCVKLEFNPLVSLLRYTLLTLIVTAPGIKPGLSPLFIVLCNTTNCMKMKFNLSFTCRLGFITKTHFEHRKRFFMFELF